MNTRFSTFPTTCAMMHIVNAILCTFCGVAAAHPGFPSEKMFQPLVAACEGLNTLKNCSAGFVGVCTTQADGFRSCSLGHGHGQHDHRHQGHGGFVGHVKAFMAKLFGKKGHCHGNHGHHMPRFVGDCGGKQDGETCSFAREGRCIPSGRGPVFKGKMACKPWDAHPPAFVTKPCEGKNEGDRCRLAGTCEKPKYADHLRCKPWWGKWWPSKDEAEDPVLEEVPEDREAPEEQGGVAPPSQGQAQELPPQEREAREKTDIVV